MGSGFDNSGSFVSSNLICEWDYSSSISDCSLSDNSSRASISAVLLQCHFGGETSNSKLEGSCCGSVLYEGWKTSRHCFSGNVSFM